jgi:hypothetical protein
MDGRDTPNGIIEKAPGMSSLRRSNLCLCLCVCVSMCSSSVVEPSSFRVFGFVGALGVFIQ